LEKGYGIDAKIADLRSQQRGAVLLTILYLSNVYLAAHCLLTIVYIFRLYIVPPTTSGVSWNHSKIIAVDGNVLHTGGHNLYDAHYLRKNPIHDLSVEFDGRVAHDGHRFANDQWLYIEVNQRTCFGYCIDKMPDWWIMPFKTRVTVSEFPVGVASVYPPKYRKGAMHRVFPGRNVRWAPVISIGRYGKITPFGLRPSDEAILAMLGSAQKSIRLSLQDFGPVCIPGTKVALPGCVWPKRYLSVIGRMIWEKDVAVDLVLSNPWSVPGGLKLTEAMYGNGWTCVDVAAEVIKTIREMHPSVSSSALREKLVNNLRVCSIRGKRGQFWEDGMTVGLHTKHVIVDDICCYM